MITAATNASTPCTAMPTMRKGSKSSHTSGYSTSAINATGQQITNSKHQARNANMGNLPCVHTLRYARPSQKVPLSHCDVYKILLQERERARFRILPSLTAKAVACIGIDLHLVRRRFLFEQLLQVIRLCHRHRRIALAMQDERRTEPAYEKLHLARHAAEKIYHRFYARIDRRHRKREIGAERKAKQPNPLRIDFRP